MREERHRRSLAAASTRHWSRAYERRCVHRLRIQLVPDGCELCRERPVADVLTTSRPSGDRLVVARPTDLVEDVLTTSRPSSDRLVGARPTDLQNVFEDESSIAVQEGEIVRHKYLWVPKMSSTPRDQAIFMDEAAEPICSVQR